MSITVHIPTPLRPFVDNAETISVDQLTTIDTVVQHLVTTHPGLKKYLLDDKGRIRNFVNLYLNEEDIRYLNGPATAVKDGDVLSIVPSIAGGRS